MTIGRNQKCMVYLCVLIKCLLSSAVKNILFQHVACFEKQNRAWMALRSIAVAKCFRRRKCPVHAMHQSAISSRNFLDNPWEVDHQKNETPKNHLPTLQMIFVANPSTFMEGGNQKSPKITQFTWQIQPASWTFCCPKHLGFHTDTDNHSTRFLQPLNRIRAVR